MKDQRLDVLLENLNLGPCRWYEVIDRGIYICHRIKDEYDKATEARCHGEIKACKIENKTG